MPQLSDLVKNLEPNRYRGDHQGNVILLNWGGSPRCFGEVRYGDGDDQDTRPFKVIFDNPEKRNIGQEKRGTHQSIVGRQTITLSFLS